MDYTDAQKALYESMYVGQEARLRADFQLMLKDLEKTYEIISVESNTISPTGAAYDAVLGKLNTMRSIFLSKGGRNIDPDLRKQIRSVSAFEETLARILQEIDSRIEDMVKRGGRLPQHEQGHFKVDAPKSWMNPGEQINEQRPKQKAWQGYAERPEPDESSSANEQDNEPVEDPVQRLRDLKEKERREIEKSQEERQKATKEHGERMAKMQRERINKQAELSRRRFGR